MIEIKNAKIESTKLGFDRGVFLTFWLYLTYGGSGQGAGGYVLDNSSMGEADVFSMKLFSDLLNTLGVEKWEELPNTFIRVKSDMGKVHAVGHILKDNWFDLNKMGKYLYDVKAQNEEEAK